MYRGFKLKLEPAKFADYEEDGAHLHELFSNALKERLEEYVVSDTVLDGSKMQADWFPQFKGDLFISHSHADEKLAKGLAGWLYSEFELVTFIDSCIWGHADKLLRKLDDAHCKEPSGRYNYDRRNRSTAHVHMMLHNALSKVIDHSECLFFLDTPSSTVKDMVYKKTESPWIYSELSLSRLIRKKIPERSVITELFKAYSGGGVLNESQQEEARIQYLLELDHLANLNTADLFSWARNFEIKKSLLHVKAGHSLDTLYDFKPLKKTK